MKKLIAIFIMAMMVPFSAFSMEMLSDDVMGDVTGQAGVSIAADIQMDISFDTLAWGDSDGVDSDAAITEGWIGLTDVDITGLRIHLRTDLVPTPQDIQLFAIDVGTDAGVTKVYITLGTQQIDMATFDATVSLGDSATNMTQVMGKINIDDFHMLMGKDSTVAIYAHDGSGITIDFDVKIDKISWVAMAWGDLDGIGTRVVPGLNNAGDAALTKAGYVGLANGEVLGLNVTGALLIDVATIDDTSSGVMGAAGLLSVYSNMLATGYDGGRTAVLMEFQNTNVTMASFKADVVLADNDTLTDASGTGVNATTMGSCYISNMDVTMNGWVGIFAH